MGKGHFLPLPHLADTFTDPQLISHFSECESIQDSKLVYFRLVNKQAVR